MIHFRSVVMTIVAGWLIVTRARTDWIKPSAATLGESELPLYPGTSRVSWRRVALRLAARTVLSDHGRLINGPLCCWRLTETEKWCGRLLDPADVRRVGVAARLRCRSINERQSFADKGEEKSSRPYRDDGLIMEFFQQIFFHQEKP